MPVRAVISSKTLRLSEPLETRLMDHVKKRHTDVKTEMGFVSEGIYDGWLKARKVARAQYANDFSDRLGTQGGLYEPFNDCSLNIPQRAVRVYCARARDGLLNAKPFCGIQAEGPEDETPPKPAPGLPTPPNPIKLADRFWQHKLNEAEAEATYRAGIEQAAVCGEVVNKITVRDAEPHEDEMQDKPVWLDADGNPLKDTRGRFVFADEEFEDDPEILGQKLLKRDPSVIMPEGAAPSEDLYPPDAPDGRKILDIKAIDYRDFICSPTAEDIHTTDYIAHVYDTTLDQLWDSFPPGLRINPEAKQWLENLKAQSTQAKSDSGRANAEQGEKEQGENGPIRLQLAESWLRYSPRDNGKCEEICVLWETSSGYPIHYEVRREVSVTGKRPFEVDRIIPEPNRWWGIGFYNLLSPEHAFCDRQIARIETRTSSSGRLTYYRKGTLEGVEDGNDLEFNSTNIETATEKLKEGQQPVEHIELPAMDEQIWQLMQTRMQQATLKTGTMTPGDAAAVKLNPSETLGGQEMLAAESELITHDTTQDVRKGIEASLKQSIIAVFTNYDPTEANEVLGIKNGEALTEWLSQNKPRSLLNRVKLLMTRAKSRMQIQANQQALTSVVGDRSWLDIQSEQIQGMLPPGTDELVKPLFSAVLENNDIENVDAMLKTLPPDMAPMAQPGVPPGQPPLPSNASPFPAAA